MNKFFRKKLLLFVVVIALALCAIGCGETEEPVNTPTKTVYVLGPTPEHGWLGQAGSFASKKCDELMALGVNAKFIPSISGEEQARQCADVISNGDAGCVVMMAMDDDAEEGQELLFEAGIPLVQFDLIFENTEKRSALNYSGNNWQCGAGVAYWLQDNGMEQTSAVVVLTGDESSVSTRREEGFKNFLLGNDKNDDYAKTGYYIDEREGEFFTTTKWTTDQVESVFDKYDALCLWSEDAAAAYLKENMPAIISEATGADGKLFIFSMDDEMVFGILDYLELASEDEKAAFENLDVYVASIGGMQELYDMMKGDSLHSEIADKYFDDIMTMNFSSKMINDAIDFGVRIAGGENVAIPGTGLYAPTYIVDASLAKTEEGYYAR